MTAAGYTLTRTDGKAWSTVNGFTIGDVVQIVDGSNVGVRTVTAVSGTMLTLGGSTLTTVTVAEAVLVVRTEIVVAIDRVAAGRDIDLELRTGVRQSPGSGTGDVEVIVPRDIVALVRRRDPPFPLPRHEHHPGYDPARTGVSAILDPAVYPLLSAGVPVDVAIDSHYRFELRNVPLARSDVPFPGTGLAMFEPKTSGGEYILFAGTAAAAKSPGLIAGRHIVIRDSEGIANGPLAADIAGGKTIRIFGYTNLADAGSGWLDVNVDGSVVLEEISGDLRVGLVRSRASTVKLTAAVSILDADPGDSPSSVDDPQDVQGARDHADRDQRLDRHRGSTSWRRTSTTRSASPACSPRLPRSASTSGRSRVTSGSRV